MANLEQLYVRLSAGSSKQKMQEALGKGQKVFAFVIDSNWNLFVTDYNHMSIWLNDGLTNEDTHEGELWISADGSFSISTSSRQGTKSVAEVLQIDLWRSKEHRREIAAYLQDFFQAHIFG